MWGLRGNEVKFVFEFPVGEGDDCGTRCLGKISYFHASQKPSLTHECANYRSLRVDTSAAFGQPSASYCLYLKMINLHFFQERKKEKSIEQTQTAHYFSKIKDTARSMDFVRR